MDASPRARQLRLFDDPGRQPVFDPEGLHADLRAFVAMGSPTAIDRRLIGGRAVATYVNEFWTAAQRAANRLHEISYRACFKPQLPAFFISRLSRPGDVVHDPFLGRGTTMIEAALLGRVPVGCDVNPLSRILVEPRLRPPTVEDVASRLEQIDFALEGPVPDDLHVFYHPETLREICALRRHLSLRHSDGTFDGVDAWIQMVAVNRLTGHSPGFFSVYTMPPNQAVSRVSQARINARRGQKPERRDVPALILRKTRSLLAGIDVAIRQTLASVAADPRAGVHVSPAAHTSRIPSGSVRLVVTSPPFLDVVQYRDDNWLRCWFCEIDVDAVPISIHRRLEDWEAAMTSVFRELFRVLAPGGHVAFEVGEVRKGSIRLEESVVPCGVAAGLEPTLILIHDQEFTKTANCWGVANNRNGTNTHRIVVFRKPG